RPDARAAAIDPSGRRHGRPGVGDGDRARPDASARAPNLENPMALTRQTLTDEQRKSVAIEYLKAYDNAGVTSTGGSILELFATDAQGYFPKWGITKGREQIRRSVRCVA